MLKWLRSIDWLAINTSALALCVLLFVVSWLPSRQHNDYQPQQAPQDKASDLLLGLRPEEWTALFTGLLTISTIGLWFVTRRGANTAAQALTVLERPWLVHDALRIYRERGTERGIRFNIQNIGRSPGFLKSFQGGGKHSMNEIDPETIKMCIIPMPLLGNVIVQNKPGGQSDIKISSLSDDLIVEIEKGTVKLYNRTIITYADIFGQTHETAFCVRYNHATKGFEEYGGELYNYLT
jgi:hypothetical protein